MCMEKVSYHYHTEPIEAYKTVLKLKDGRLVSPKPHLHGWTDFVFENGTNSTSNEHGICSYATKKAATLLAQALAAFNGMYKDVESVGVIKIKIPPTAETKKEYHWDSELGYVSMTVEAKTKLIAEFPTKANMVTFIDGLKALGFKKNRY